MNANSKFPLAALLGTSLTSVALLFATFISGVFVARALGPEARGDYGAILMIAQASATLGTLGYFDGAIVVIRRTGLGVAATFPASALTAALLAFGACSIFYVLAIHIDFSLVTVDQAAVLPFCIMIITITLLCSLFISAERSQMQFTIVNLLALAPAVLFSIAIAAMSLGNSEKMPTTTIISIFVVAQASVLAVWFVRYRRLLLGRLSLGFARDAFLTGITLYPTAALLMVSGQIDRLFAIGTWDRADLGQYFVAFSAVGAGYAVVTTALRTVLFPYLSGLTGDRRRMVLEQLLRVSIILSVCVFILGQIIVPYAIPILYGKVYEPAVAHSNSLLWAMAILPVQTFVLEANRSGKRSLAAVLMQMTVITVMLIGYAVTGLESPGPLILTLGIANVFATLVGIIILAWSRNIGITSDLLPRAQDIFLIRKMLRDARLQK